MKLKKILIAGITFFAVTLAVTLSGSLKLTTHAVPDFTAKADSYSDPAIPDEVYISRKFVHFSEDFQADKTMRSFVDRKSFLIFTFKNGKISRDIFFVTNPEGIDDDGFYRIQCDIVKKEVRSTLRIYDVRIARITKSPTRLSAVRSDLVQKMTSSINGLSSVDLTPLYKANPKSPRLTPVSAYISPSLKNRGLDVLEYIGGGGGRHLFRCLLANADTEAQRKERSTARGYFCYLDYDMTRSRVDAYFTVVDYSVYIK